MTIALRSTIEALLLGTSGTTRTMDAGRFHLAAPDGAAIEDHPSNAAERTIRVILGMPVAKDGWNSLDPRVTNDVRCTIQVRYLYTGAGGDGTEALSEQDGSGTIDAIRDRAMTDAHAIQRVLNWHENYSNTDPRIISITQDGEPSGPVVQGDRAIVEFPYRVLAEFTVPGTGYEP
jgi:hypothetical protein